MSIKFLHAADIHLDSPLRGLMRYENAPVDRIRGASRRAFSRMIDLAIEQKVDFVVISGDLYDGESRDFNTCLYLTSQLQRLRDAKIPAYVISGNHDAANRMTRTLRLPENVHLLRSDRAETLRLDDLEVAIHGQSFAKAAVTENLAAAYPGPVAGYLNIGLLHTAMAGADGHERYAPCSVEDLRARGYDYWALGHVHTRKTHCDDPPIVFPGNVQGRHIRERGEKGCVLTTLQNNGASSQAFHRLDVVRWEECRVDVADLRTESELFERISGTLDDLLATEFDEERLLAVRVVLRGVSTLHDRLLAHHDRSVAEILNLATDRGRERIWVEKCEFQTRSPRGIAVHEGPMEELREVIESLRERPAALADLGKELGDLGRKLPQEITSDSDAPRLDDPQWLAGLLDHVQPLLLDLLQAQGRESSP